MCKMELLAHRNMAVVSILQQQKTAANEIRSEVSIWFYALDYQLRCNMPCDDVIYTHCVGSKRGAIGGKDGAMLVHCGGVRREIRLYLSRGITSNNCVINFTPCFHGIADLFCSLIHNPMTHRQPTGR